MNLKNLLMYIFFILFLLFSCQNSNNIPSSFISGNVVNAGNYPSIQDAVDALPDEGGTVFIPADTYKISEPIIVTKSDVTLHGAGSGTLLLNISEEGKNTIELKGERQPEKSRSELEIWRVKVCNMHLKGNEKCGHGIYAQYVNEISLIETWVDYHGKSGIYLDYCYENPRVSDNNIAYNKENGILIDGCHDIVVSANQLEENGIGVYAKDIFNATITGNNIDDHTKHCIQFVNALGSIITGNMLENCKEASVVLDEKCDGIVLTGNILRQPGELRIINAKGVTITGNAFDMSNRNSIETEGSNFITISGNIFSGGPDDRIYGIVMKDVNDVSISGNTMVKPLEGGIYILGNENKYINITGNTIKNPSEKSLNKFSGIFLQNTSHSIISYNIIIDDRSTKIMKSAIEETGNSDYNIITYNRVNKGTSNDIIITGKNTRKEGNFVH